MPDGRITGTNKLNKISMAYNKELSQHLPGGMNDSSRKSISTARFG
jgi:hypothetical protein